MAAAVIALLGALVVAFGHIPLPPYPQFATFHAGFVMLADAMTAVLLFGQYAYRRMLFYAILASAYLFSALIVVLFLFTFPGALLDSQPVIGSTQSAIWVWHFWHIIFPAIISVAMVAHWHELRGRLPQNEPRKNIILITLITVAVVLLIAMAVTVFHDGMPVLITRNAPPLTTGFYIAGVTAFMITLVALWQTVGLAREQRALHVWLAVMLVALLADIAASLGANERFTVGWYFGRVESIITASILLVVLVKEINQLYFQLAKAMNDLIGANERLSGLVTEKDKLVEELRDSEEQILNLAYQDQMTGLANRWSLIERMQDTLAQGRRYNHNTGLLFIDLDHFKEINDNYGHDVGDALLLAIAYAIKDCVRVTDIPARIGGDEFVILVPHMRELDDAVIMAKKILASLNAPFEIMSHHLRISASIGIAMHTPDDPTDSSEFLRRADEAMYEAKKSGRNCLVIEADMTQEKAQKI